MVLYKRKPVALLPAPDGISDNQEVWSIASTGEVFADYESFLKRMDFLSRVLSPQGRMVRFSCTDTAQPKFTDSVNGKSGLSFFAALKSEARSSNAIETVFPEVLRDPILRKVQFSDIGRMDDLVTMVYDEFKRDFFPGEEVIVLLDAGETPLGIIREKAKFPMIRGPDGSIQREAFSRYFVRLPTAPNDEALVDDAHIRRDKKIFTKQNLRSFLKNSLQREAWTGAPWLVKEHLAIQYRLPMEIPSHLLQDYKIMQAKQQQAQGKSTKGRRSKGSASHDIPRVALEDLRLQQQLQQSAMSQAHSQSQTQYVHQPHARANGVQTYHRAPDSTPVAEQKPAPPPVIKYPIEDLDLPPKQNGVTRPELKFFTPQMDDYVRKGRKRAPRDIQLETLSMMLEVWNTLNVQCEVYILDSFTFDDFCDAMKYTSDDGECELLNETFCAVLKQIVDDKGTVQVKLPKVLEEEDPDLDDSTASSEPTTPEEEAPPARSTRSTRVSQIGTTEQSESPGSTLLKVHRASEALEDFDWQERLAARDMENGGWQLMLVGLFNQLSFGPEYKTRADQILEYLVPLDDEPTRDNIQQHFATMDVNLRVLALQIITFLSITTRKIKDFLETCSEDQTEVRKRKVEFQKEKKIIAEELLHKNRERKILLPQNMPVTPEPEIDVTNSIDVEMENHVEENGHDSSGSDVETGRDLRRASGRKRKREEEQARILKEKAEKAAAKEKPKQSKEYIKVLKDIERLTLKIGELTERIADCDADLREANVQRTKVLGTDRFCNRYYWFERNGQPFGGLPTSSTAHYGYANGRLWVQGPDEMERAGFIDLPTDLQDEYKAKFRMTVPERRQHEEGATRLQTAQEWGFYDDSDRLDSLIAWLDDRGEREKKLLRELRDWRDEIAKYMQARKKFFEDEAARRLELDEEQATRIHTRHAIQKDRSAAAERCLKWHNSMAIEQQRHLHSQNPHRPRAKKQQIKGVAITLTNRSGKPLTRQGSGYSGR